MESRVGIELRSLSNMIKRYIDNYSNKRYVDSITGTNSWILGYLDEHEGSDVYQRDLERAFGVTRSTASKVVELMVRKGFLTRQTVSHDGRLRKLVMTEKTKEIKELMHADHCKVEALLTQGFSEQEKKQLCAYIERMKRNIQTAQTETGGGNEG